MLILDRSHESGVSLPHHLNKSRHWVNAQDWQPGNDENRRTEWAPRSSWRHSSGGSHETRVKLETVHENHDSTTAAAQNGILDGLLASGASRASIGSFSDPGDSYGGREYNDDGVVV